MTKTVTKTNYRTPKSCMFHFFSSEDLEILINVTVSRLCLKPIFIFPLKLIQIMLLFMHGKRVISTPYWTDNICPTFDQDLGSSHGP